jgi:hypothetical protein
MRLTPVLALLALTLQPAWGQDEEILHPEVEPLQVVWEFAEKPSRVRKALMKMLELREMALDTEAGEGDIVTVFVDFRTEDFGVDDVAERSPDLSDKYLFLQPRYVLQGRMRLRAEIASSAAGTEVRVEVDLLVRAFHSLARGGDAEAVRRSNGAIETHLEGEVQAQLEQLSRKKKGR